MIVAPLKSYLIFVFMLLFCTPVFSDDGRSKNNHDTLKNTGEELNQKLQDINHHKSCHSCEAKENLEKANADKVSCLEVANSACDQLWSEENSGTLKVFDGEINVGKSKSKLAVQKIFDLKALLDSEEKLPKDLRKEAGDFFKKLKNALSTESNSEEWKQKLAEIEEQFHNAVMRIRNKRIKKRISENTPKDEEIDSIVEAGIKNDAMMNLYDEILEAKYKDSPQWKRLENLFNIVKKDTITALDKTSYDEKIKIQMKKQIESVRKEP
jgi:hypothetical protein